MINLITVVYDVELSLLQTQAQNFDSFIDTKDVSRILILVNDADLVADAIDPVWGGQHQDKVQIKNGVKKMTSTQIQHLLILDMLTCVWAICVILNVECAIL